MFNAEVIRRRGATALECAFVLPVASFVLFSLLDLGLAAVRYNALAEASRRIAREAVIRGSLARDAVDGWGPTEFVGAAADDSPMTAIVRDLLPTMDPAQVAVRVSWLDGGNAPRDRVSVALTYHHQSLVPVLVAWDQINIEASTTMRIVN